MNAAERAAKNVVEAAKKLDVEEMRFSVALQWVETAKRAKDVANEAFRRAETEAKTIRDIDGETLTVAVSMVLVTALLKLNDAEIEHGYAIDATNLTICALNDASTHYEEVCAIADECRRTAEMTNEAAVREMMAYEADLWVSQTEDAV